MKTKLLKIIFSIFMIVSLFVLSSCGDKNKPNDDTNDAAYRAIYQLYYEHETDNGRIPSEYEQWLDTIRGQDGKDGEDGISPRLRINTETNYWEISNDNGATWVSLDVKATGDNGEDGKDGISPHVGENGNWWIGSIDTQVTAIPTNGKDGLNGITPQLRIVDAYWEVSYDNGANWFSLGVKSTGEKGEKGDDGNGIDKIELDENGNLLITYTNGSTQTVPIVNGGHIHDYTDWVLISSGNSLYCRTCNSCNHTEWKQDELANVETVWSIVGNIAGTNWDFDFILEQIEESAWISEELNLRSGDLFKIRKNLSDDYYFGKDGELNGEAYPITVDGIYKIRFEWDEIADKGTITLVPVHLHERSFVTVIDPTCTEIGYTVYECACGYQYRGEYVDTIGHTEVIDQGIAATCLTKGLTEGSHCSVCNVIIIPQQQIDAIVCIYDSTVIAPTCTEQGYTIHKCTMCGTSYTDNFVDPIGHNYGEWEILDESTVRKCQNNECIEFIELLSISPSYVGSTLSIGDYASKDDIVVEALLSDSTTEMINEFVLYNDLVETEGSHIVTVTFMTLTETVSVPVNYINPENATDSSEFEYTSSSGEITITKFVGASNHVVIPAYIDNEPVKYIANYAFSNCVDLESVRVPASVDTIGIGAFSGCTGLKDVTLSEGLKTIGGRAFYNSAITSINIPDSVTTIDSYCTSTTYDNYDGAFENCTQLKTVVIGNGVENIYKDAFYGCTSLESVVIGNSVATIYPYAFHLCSALTDVSMGSGLYTISEYAFSSCHVLETIEFGENVKSVGDYAFLNCKSLTNVIISSSVEELGIGCFANCISLPYINIPGNVRTIGEYAFKGCTGLTAITLGEGLKTIGGGAFYGSALESIVIPDSVTLIDSYCTSATYDNYDGAFENCTQLKTVVIGNGLKNIYKDAFYGCTSLESVVIGNSVATIYPYAFYLCTALTDVSMGSGLHTISEYAFDFCYLLENLEIGENVKTIGEYAFANCYALNNVFISSSVETLGVHCFSNCINLTYVNIPGNVRTIGDYAFYDCSRLKEVTLNEGLKTIGGGAFYGCALKTVTIPDSVITINSHCISSYYETYDGAFEECKDLTDVVIGNGVKYIDYHAFRNCTSLQTVIIGNSVIDINGYAFYNCTSLTDVTLGDSVENIRECAFSHCTSLKNINIPSSTKLIGDNAFAYCNALPSIEISYGVTTIGVYAFSHCEKLEAVTIGERVAIIGQGAFSNCSALNKVHIPGSVQTIGDKTFESCTQLRIVVIDKGNLRTIGKNAFYGCDNVFRTFYGGDSYDWKLINLSVDNRDDFQLTNTIYFYHEAEPEKGEIGNYWHYNSDGEPRIWNSDIDSFCANIYADEFNINYVDQTFLPEKAYDVLANDFSFINNAIWWESLHLATEPSHALESGMISKQNIYMLALFDVLIAADTEISPVLKLVDSTSMAYLNELINKYFPDKTFEALGQISEFDEALKLDLLDSVSSSAIGVIGKIIENAQSVGEAFLYIARYSAVETMDLNYRIILAEIALDEENPIELRLAAKAMVELMQSTMTEVCLQIVDCNLQNDVLGTIADKMWECVLDYTGLRPFQAIGKGLLFLGNELFAMDDTLQAYYRLGTSVDIEKSLKRMVKVYESDYSRHENIALAAKYVDLISMYRSVLLKQYDYALGLNNLSDDLRVLMEHEKSNTKVDFERIDTTIKNIYDEYFS